MGYALVGTTHTTVFGAAGGTTGSIDTTGVDCIFIVLTYHDSTAKNISDNKGNTYTAQTPQETSPPGAGAVIYFANASTGAFTVGTGHTFTTTSHFCGVNVLPVSGSRTATTPFDQQNGTKFNAGSGTTIQPGSITTSVAGCIVVTGVCNFNGTAPVIPTGYTVIGNTYTTATAEAGGAAYLILTGTSTENPTWTGMTNGDPWSAVIADFMPPASAATTNPAFILNFL